MTEKKLTDDKMKDILFQCYVNAEKGEGTTEVQLKAMREYAAQQVAAERERIKTALRELPKEMWLRELDSL